MELVDVEEESVLTSIFQDCFPESWQRNPDFAQYLSELSSFGVEKLAQEPDRLSEEKSQILEETQNLAFQNYKTFIQTAECSRDIFQDFQIIEKHVGGLLDKLPGFAENCDTVLKQAQDISSSRRMNTLTLQRHTQLLEILEVPQLMDTCVRNCYYDEALELAAHVKRLEKKHVGIPVIANIVSEVKLSSQLMLNQLIQQLRTNIQLPACLRVIGYLRRMDVFSEAELRLKFLQARDAWFQGILDSIPREDAYTHITKTVEASRVHLFDIITQYRAIFSDEDPLLSTSKDDSVNEAALFHGWIVQKVSQFLSLLEADLTRGVGGRLDSILGQCMYFGLSFSRVGADFRGLLTPVFQRAALNGLKLALSDANKRFEDDMKSYNLMATSSSLGGLAYSSAIQTSQLYPPTILLEFHPLAVYCNNVLTAFNELRLCTPVALASDVALALHNSFLAINKIILAFHKTEATTFDEREGEQFAHFCGAYAHSLLPYVNKCLQSLFPPAQIAQILGVSISDMFRMGNIGQVDTKSVLSNIEHLIPAIEEPPSSPIATGSLTDQSETTVDKQQDNIDQSVPVLQVTRPSSEFDAAEPLNQSETVMTDSIQSETVMTDSIQSETVMTDSIQSDDGLQFKKVTFITGSDTEEELPTTETEEGNMAADVEIDLSKDIDMGALQTGTVNSDTIESDLSALAADVLGTNVVHADVLGTNVVHADVLGTDVLGTDVFGTNVVHADSTENKEDT